MVQDEFDVTQQLTSGNISTYIGYPPTSKLKTTHEVKTLTVGGSMINKCFPKSVTTSQYKDFTIIEKIGEGEYGSVSKVRHKDTNTLYAWKRTEVNEVDGEDGMKQTSIREMSLLNNLNHPSIVDLKQTFWKDDGMFFVLEYGTCDLDTFMDMESALNPYRIRKWAHSLIDGIAYCHQRDVLHRDIKPANILVSPFGKLKLADFGLAREVWDHDMTLEVGTLWYRCPEILIGNKKYGKGVDTWSLGVIIAEMFRSSTYRDNNDWPLFAKDNAVGQMFEILNSLGTTAFFRSEKCRKLLNGIFPNFPGEPNFLLDAIPGASFLSLDIISRFLRLDVDDRLSATKALKHPWFKKRHVQNTKQSNRVG